MFFADSRHLTTPIFLFLDKTKSFISPSDFPGRGGSAKAPVEDIRSERGSEFSRENSQTNLIRLVEKAGWF